MQPISTFIRQRRAIFPASFVAGQTIPDDMIWELLEDANHAPTHKLTQPWRFRVISAEARQTLGLLLAEAYKKETTTETFSQLKYDKTIKNAGLASHILAIGLQRSPQETLPEWEEIAAMAMAVQNIWLAASAMGLGGYWSSPHTADSEAIRAYLQWSETERCYGFFYLGYPQTAATAAAAKRNPIADKVKWL